MSGLMSSTDHRILMDAYNNLHEYAAEILDVGFSDPDRLDEILGGIKSMVNDLHDESERRKPSLDDRETTVPPADVVGAMTLQLVPSHISDDYREGFQDGYRYATEIHVRAEMQRQAAELTLLREESVLSCGQETDRR